MANQPPERVLDLVDGPRPRHRDSHTFGASGGHDSHGGGAFHSNARPLDSAAPMEIAHGQPLARICVLGVIRATSHSGENILPRGRKARALLGYLCLNPGQPVARSRIHSRKGTLDFTDPTLYVGRAGES